MPLFSLFSPRAKAEAAMVDWLAHPSEFGERPRAVRYRRTLRAKAPVTDKKVRVHLVQYEMPDGVRGRGFVGPFVFGFADAELERVDDEELLKAYLGMGFVTSAAEGGILETGVAAPQAEKDLRALLAEHNFENVLIEERYRLGEVDLFEFSASSEGKKIRGAGNEEYCVYHNEDEPLFHIGHIFLYFGDM